MYRRIHTNHTSLGKVSGVQTLLNGGSGTSTPKLAISNLGGISTDELSLTNGVLKYVGDVIDSSLFNPVDTSNIPTISGNTTVDINSTNTYQITNYNSYINYIVTPVAGMGTASINKDIITYNSSVSQGKGGFIINNRVVSILVKSVMIEAPAITTGSTKAIELDILSSAYTPLKTLGSHASSDWELYDTLGLTKLQSSYDDAVHLTNWLPSGLVKGISYGVKVRYKSTLGECSDWSLMKYFTCIEAPVAGTLTFKINGVDSTASVIVEQDIIALVVKDGNTIKPGTINYVWRINGIADATLNDQFNGVIVPYNATQISVTVTYIDGIGTAETIVQTWNVSVKP